ncbi:MAG: hypothetical protein H6Q86_29 [candidate division NC10 bacterium]|jgi:hypothetical protein|nr:hypothetical protein [candidate division NC10 bacterium]
MVSFSQRIPTVQSRLSVEFSTLVCPSVVAASTAPELKHPAARQAQSVTRTTYAAELEAPRAKPAQRDRRTAPATEPIWHSCTRPMFREPPFYFSSWHV